MNIENPYFSKISDKKVRDARDRFHSDIIYEYNKFRFRETYDKPMISKSVSDKLHEVKIGEINNLPLISFLYYGTVKLWWIIAEANDIHDPLIIESGTMLIIPDIATYYKSTVERVGLKSTSIS